MTTVVSTISTLLLWAALPGILLFIFFYSRKSPWKKHFVGRSIMYLACSLAFLMVFNVTALMFGQYPGRWAVRLVGYTLLCGAVWRLFYTLRLLQKNPPSEGPDVIITDPSVSPQEALDDRL